MFQRIVIFGKNVFAVLGGDGSNAEVLNAAASNPAHSAVVTTIEDNPQAFDSLLATFANRSSCAVKPELDPTPLAFGYGETSAVDTVSQDLSLKLLPSLPGHS